MHHPLTQSPKLSNSRILRGSLLGWRRACPVQLRQGRLSERQGCPRTLRSCIMEGHLWAAPTIPTTPTGLAYVVPRAVEDLDQRAATLLGRGVGVKCHSIQGGMAQPNCSRAATSVTNEVWQTDELHFA